MQNYSLQVLTEMSTWQTWRYVNSIYGTREHSYVFMNSVNVKIDQEDDTEQFFKSRGWPILTEETYDETFDD